MILRLAKAGITKIVSTAKQLFEDFGKPIDQADQQSFALGANFSSPAFLTTDVSAVTAAAGINCGLSIIKAADGLLFPDDGFSPIIPIKANQAWLGVEFDLTGTVECGRQREWRRNLVQRNRESKLLDLHPLRSASAAPPVAAGCLRHGIRQFLHGHESGRSAQSACQYGERYRVERLCNSSGCPRSAFYSESARFGESALRQDREHRARCHSRTRAFDTNLRRPAGPFLTK